MQIIQPHYHAITRTTHDYERMAHSGVVAVAEPAFWAGFDREYAGTFLDYFHQLSDFEPKRAGQYGIDHYCWLGVNPKEAENTSLSKEVLSEMTKFFERDNVLGVGEIGFHKTTKNEEEIFEAQVDLAIKHDQMILIHTPHLGDKVRGTRRTLDVLKNCGANPDRVCIDHVEEHTVRAPLDAGYWVGMTLYPITKCSPKRACDILEMYGKERVMINSAADWGPSDPFTVHQAIMEFRKRGATLQEAVDVFHNTPAKFMGQCPKFKQKQIRVVEEEAVEV